MRTNKIRLKTHVTMLLSRFEYQITYETFLVDLRECNHFPHLILLTETWLTNNDDLSTFNIPGYHSIEPQPRTNGHLSD